MSDETTNEAYEEAEAMAGKVPSLLEGLVEKLGAVSGAQAVFAKPVKEDGRTIVPVAQSMIGTGAGGGGDTEGGSGSGLGAGGGAMTKPIGYIEITPSGAAFVPLQQPWADAKLVLVYTLLALVISRAVVKLIRD